ncbi:MAG TPA: bifunctional DNA-formamidopyrimidine glycosylase/DNA-(apurinic or apyrimidinic site) lyase [Gemmatirosa sp.]|nr:bifunctional DNA-formamidopyrimidine glycosylase/DNA-(apurinic or apyrimidinic site) lyase [Gemmatirosa sp.]
MPELPEVEAAARRLRPSVVGRRIVTVRALHPSTARALPPEAAARIVGRRVEELVRRGKHQLLRLDDGSVVHAHFRMAGDWHVGPSAEAPPRHARAALDLDDGHTVTLVDGRALGTLVWHPSLEAALPALGPDAIEAAFDAAHLAKALRGRRGPVKPALLDQRLVAGIGNIYAAEALWEARVDPRVVAGRLGPLRLARVVDGVRAVLARALADPGRYQDDEALDRLQVYGREGAPCPRCGTPVRRIVQAGRSTYFCAGCQRR